VDLFRQLEAFRVTHPITIRQVHDHCWQYIASGAGAETVVLLPGGLGTAETSFQYITAFESNYRVLSLSYPATARCVADLVDGIAGLLCAEGVTQAHLIGGSYSGMLAQCFVRRNPAHVRKLILSHSGVPWPPRIRSFELYAKVLSGRSIGAMRAFARLANRAAFHSSTAAQLFWKSYFDRLFNALPSAALSSLFQVMLDFDRNYIFAPNDLSEWAGEILIVDADGDRYISRAERCALRALYPAAQTHRFSGRGHSGPLENAEEYIALYRAFLGATPLLSSAPGLE
jgi:pimeloyl-ACP methyl ester carboxylesterase